MGLCFSICSRRSLAKQATQASVTEEPHIHSEDAIEEEQSKVQLLSTTTEDNERIDDNRPSKRIRITSAISGNEMCEVDAKDSWDIVRLKSEIEMLTGTATAHQHLMFGDHEIQDDDELRKALFGKILIDEDATSISLVKVNWIDTIASSHPEIRSAQSDLGLEKLAGRVTTLVGDEWMQCSTSTELPSVTSPPDYFVALKVEIAETWRQTDQWGQILLFTANGFPNFEEYPFRCPNFVLECDGEPKLLVIVSNQADVNQHIGDFTTGLACTDYDLPTGVEISVMLAVVGDTAAVYINGEEVKRDRVGKRFTHDCMKVYANPPNEGWISMHGYEVPNEHVRIRQVSHVALSA
jgi:hypothetical protein